MSAVLMATLDGWDWRERVAQGYRAAGGSRRKNRWKQEMRSSWPERSTPPAPFCNILLAYDLTRGGALIGRAGCTLVGCFGKLRAMSAPVLACLRVFRSALHDCFARRVDALFELSDVLLAADLVTSLPHLSLQVPHRRSRDS